MNSMLSNEKNIFTQYNNGIKIISSTSMSTDLSSIFQHFQVRLCTKPTHTIIKLDKRNTLNTPVNVSLFYFYY